MPEPPMTAKLSAEELERLEALAKAATPGPWTWTPQELEKERDGKFVPVTAANIDGPFVFETGEGYMGCDDANAAYIAAANPSVLLRLTAQVREAEALKAWQPIETAPKDGTEIIVFDGHDISIAAWRGAAEWVCQDLCMEQPTHWQPLPPPPARLEKERTA